MADDAASERAAAMSQTAASGASPSEATACDALLAADLGVAALHVLGDYWTSDLGSRTDLGWLIHRARDLADPAAAAELAERFALLAVRFDPRLVRSRLLVLEVPAVEVPPVGAAASGRSASSVPAVLAGALAGIAGIGEYRPGVVVRRNPVPRMRQVQPERHASLADAAGWEVLGSVEDHHVVLVDDVILTGSTVRAVAQRLTLAGALSVTAAVAARTRRRRR